jgi:GST-like protein
VGIMLEECGLPYRPVPVNIGVGEQYSRSFRKINPNARVPALIDYETRGDDPFRIFESGAILLYLGRAAQKFVGTEHKDRSEIEQWVVWQSAGLGPFGGQAQHYRMAAPGLLPDSQMYAYPSERFTREVHRLYAVLNHQLRNQTYICGDYSIADMACWPWVVTHRAQGIELGDFPEIQRWFQLIASRDAVKRAMRLGSDLPRGPVDHARLSQAAQSAIVELLEQPQIS